MVDLSIIIVNYNTGEYLTRCVKSIIDSGYKLSRIQFIIIDNASKDNSIELTKNILKKYDSNFKIILNSSNIGFSKAVNKGIDSTFGKYVCLLNPDTYIEKKCFNYLIEYMNLNEDISCITPKIINSDGHLQVSCKRSLPTIRNSFYKFLKIDKIFSDSKSFSEYNLLHVDEDKITQVDVISGAFMLFKSAVIQKVGKFDEEFYLYGEDIDYCKRMKSNNFKIIYYPLAKVIHYKGISAESHPFSAIYHFHSSMIKYFKKYRNEYQSWKISCYLIIFFITIKKYLAYLYLIFKQSFKLK